MTPTQTFDTFPEFGNNSTRTEPDDAKKSAGFVASDVLPAEWMNWEWNKASKGITALNAGLLSTEQEINAVLTAGGVTPSAESSGQLLQAIQYLLNQAKKDALPVGFIYPQWPGEKSPAEMGFSGTWTVFQTGGVIMRGEGGTAREFTPKFTCTASGTTVTFSNTLPTTTQLKVGDSLSANGQFKKVTETNTSGSNVIKCTIESAFSAAVTSVMIGVGADSHTHTTQSHTLTSLEMPSHTHTFTGSSATTGTNSVGHTHTVTAKGSISGGAYKFTGTGHTHTFTGSSATTSSDGNHFHYLHPTDSSKEFGCITGGWVGNDAGDSGSAAKFITAKTQTNSVANSSYTSTNGAHTHTLTATGTNSTVTATGSISITTNPTFTGSSATSGSQSANHTHTVTAKGSNSSTGGNGAHAHGDTGSSSNLPPEITVRFWKRTA